ncbi:BTAD domain-containing putative transcriptional regulator [Streptomyces rimosus]|uniref:AfsR/SARP family transcriptional regulator n=1 Tax=Streptomyces rimosus TaxID=1927 RepID=UPI0031DF9CA1
MDQEYPAAAKEAAEAAWESGTPEQTLPVLRQAAEQHPLDEEPQARLMRALAATGRQAEALEAHRALQARLKEELGSAPGQEVRAGSSWDMNRHLDLNPTARAAMPGPRAPEGRPAVAPGCKAGAPIAYEQHLATGHLAT